MRLALESYTAKCRIPVFRDGGLPMDVKMIFAGAYFVGTVLSFTILFRILQLSVGLWFKGPSCQSLTVNSDVEQPVETDRIFRT
jgi:hypothetical protein